MMTIIGSSTWTVVGVSLVGLVGVASIAPVVPELIRRVIPRDRTPRLPLRALAILGLIQTGLVVVGSAWIGARLGFPFGLRSCLFNTAKSGAIGQPCAVAFIYGGSAAFSIGVLGGLAVFSFAKPLVAYLRSTPLLTRLLYGGLTEEVLMRWGLLASVAWLSSHVMARGVPSRGAFLAAIVVTNGMFAAAHLPLLRSSHVMSSHKAATAIFLVSLPWGWLAWTFGLEAAMVAHISFHACVELLARRVDP